MAIQGLKPSAVKLLNKIALLNNQSFSKQLLSVITDIVNSGEVGDVVTSRRLPTITKVILYFTLFGCKK